MKATILALATVVAFQATWLAVAFSATAGRPALGVAACAAALAFGLVTQPDRLRLAALAAALALCGLAAESLLVRDGLLRFAGPGSSGLAPFWIVALWAAFAILIEPAFAMLRDRPVIAALLGLLFGPLSYLAAERIGALTLGDPRHVAIAAIAVLWAVALPGAIRLSALLAARLGRRD